MQWMMDSHTYREKQKMGGWQRQTENKKKDWMVKRVDEIWPMDKVGGKDGSAELKERNEQTGYNTSLQSAGQSSAYHVRISNGSTPLCSRRAHAFEPVNNPEQKVQRLQAHIGKGT